MVVKVMVSVMVAVWMDSDQRVNSTADIRVSHRVWGKRMAMMVVAMVQSGMHSVC